MRSSQRIGQVHRWFFFEALDDDLVPQPDGREFSGWQWITIDDLIGRVVDFRKRPYRQVLGTMAGNGG
jgi:8-oxo-dGTP pyrophosphatase MutT (NUDIX family)